MNSIPLVFETNAGQAGAPVKFIVHRAEIKASFAPDSISLALPGKKPKPGAASVKIDFNRAARIIGEQEQPGKINYLHGNDPAAWHTNIATFGRLRYSQLWPGIDLLFYGNGEHLEHDFLVAPGADPGRIAFVLNGAASVKTNAEGDLLVNLEEGRITFEKPVAYQETATGRRPVQTNFKLDGNKVSFKVGSYDRSQPLIIDPVLVFSTLLAGSSFDQITSMTVDAQNNIYVVGETNSTDFPVTGSAEQPTCNTCSIGDHEDAFVTKLNPTGTALIYSTYLGGSDLDTARSVVVDSSGNAIVSGNTLSGDFPSVNPIGTFTTKANWHMFVASLSPTGSALNYSGVVGALNVADIFSNPNSIPSSIFPPLAVDSSRNVYATVQTVFPSFPTTPSAIAPVPPNPQAAVLMALKISPAGSLVYSTTIPGRAAQGNSGGFPTNTFIQTAIAVDSAGSAYIAGRANDGLPTTLGVIGPAFASDSGFFVFFPQEGFLLKLNPAGSAVAYATYIPGTSQVNDMRLDSSNNAYLGGTTNSPLLPVSATGFQKDPGCTGCEADFLLKVNPTATAVLAGTYLRGAPRKTNDQATLAHIALDANGNVLATGSDIEAGHIPMKNPMLQLEGGFIIELSSDLSTLLFSSGGPDSLIEVAPSGKIIMAGSNVFPPTPGAFQTTPPPGRVDSSVPTIAAIDLTVAAPATCLAPFSLSFGSGVVAPGTTTAPQSATVTNCGNADLHISSVTSDSPNFAVTTTCPLAPAAITPGGSCTVSATYSPVNYNSGSIVVANDALQSPHFVDLFGFPKAPFTVVHPTSLSFPETPVTSSFGLGMDITNSGVTNLTVTSMSTTGDFSLSQSCAGAVLTPPTPSPLGPLFHFCNFTVAFSPTNVGTRNGTLIVNDTSLDSPHVFQLTGLGIAAWPTPVLNAGSTVTVTGTGGGVNSSPGKSLIFPLIGAGFSRVTTATLDGIPFDNFGRLFTLINPTEIDLQLVGNDFGDFGEVPVTVTSPGPGGGTFSSSATIFSPVKTDDPLFRTIDLLGAGSIVLGPKSGSIYDSLGNNFIFVPNMNTASLVMVDPVTARVTKGVIGFPHAPTALAISDDEQFLYAAFTDNNTVAQISLPSGTINFMASLGQDPALGKYNATSLRVMPGHPHTWVAALQPLLDTKPIALKVFDDSTPRANTVEQGNSTSIFPGKLLFVGTDTSTLYSIDSTSLYRFNIDANGITFRDKTAGLGGADFDTDGTLLYLANGAVIDPGTLANKGNFALAPGLQTTAIAVDSSTSRAIYAAQTPNVPNPSALYQAFDTQTLAAKGTLNFAGAGPGSLLRWGTNGLATGNGAFLITRSSLTGNSGQLAPFHIGQNGGAGAIGAVQVSQGTNAVYNLGMIPLNGFTGPVTFSCAHLPQFASCSFSVNPVNVGKGLPNQLIVTISTHSATASNVVTPATYAKSGTGFVLLAGLLSLPFALAFAGRRYRTKLLALCLLLLAVGCGGGGSGGGGGTPTPTPIFSPTPTATPSGGNTPIGTYDIILTGTSSQGSRQATLQLLIVG